MSDSVSYFSICNSDNCLFKFFRALIWLHFSSFRHFSNFLGSKTSQLGRKLEVVPTLQCWGFLFNSYVNFSSGNQFPTCNTGPAVPAAQLITGSAAKFVIITDLFSDTVSSYSSTLSKCPNFTYHTKLFDQQHLPAFSWFFRSCTPNGTSFGQSTGQPGTTCICSGNTSSPTTGSSSWSSTRPSFTGAHFTSRSYQSSGWSVSYWTW